MRPCLFSYSQYLPAFVGIVLLSCHNGWLLKMFSIFPGDDRGRT
jgi:hypothetical protein